MEDAITVHRIVKELNMKTSKYENMKTPSPILLTIHTYQICQRALFTGTHDRVSSISEPFSSKIVCISSVHKVDQHWSKLITAISLMSITMVSYSHKSVEYSTSLYFHYCILWNRLKLVVWAISDKEDTVTLEAVWNVIHTRCPTATVSTLMTGDGSVTYKEL